MVVILKKSMAAMNAEGEPMRLASIDIGTNSVRLMVVEKRESCLKTLYRGTKITRLGEGVNKKQVLSDSAIERTILVLKEYKEIVEDYGAEKIKVAATSAMRDSKNALVFIGKVKKEVGLNVGILTGKEEAECSFLGATYGYQQDYQSILVIDIGGGSTELILGSPGCLEEIFSLNIGSVRLTEMFVKHDPPLESEIRLIEDYVCSVGKKSFESIGKKKDLFCMGLAGTITTLSAISQRMEIYDSERIHGSKLSFSEIKKILNYLLSKNLTERKNIAGLESGRVDIIIAGAVILKEVMRNLALEEIIVSECDILDGLILSMDC